MATNVEVYWPDGRSVARPLEPSDLNSVLEIRYPKDEEEVTPTMEIEVHYCVIVLLNSHYRKDYSALYNFLSHDVQNPKMFLLWRSKW